MNRPLTASLLFAATLLLGCSTEPSPAVVAPAEEAAEAPKVAQLALVPGEGKGFVSFVATKNESVEVPGRFLAQTGGLQLKGNDLSTLTGGIDVALQTVDTHEAKRDVSLREALFQLVDGAAGSARVDVVSLSPEQKSLAPGERTVAAAKLKIGILGGGATVDASVEIGRISETRWSVRSVAPVPLSLEGLGMAAQAAALKERCGHEKLGDGVEISFVLAFEG